MNYSTFYKFLIGALAIAGWNLSKGQVIEIDPVFPTLNDTITLIYHADEGNGVLAGVTPVYAHQGVLTDQSNAPSDWKNVQTDWGTTDGLMEDLGNNTHRFVYPSSISEFYQIGQNEVPPSATVTDLSFVFRNADGSAVGRSADGGDIFYPVYDGVGLQARIVRPNDLVFVDFGSTFSVKGASSISATLTFFLNDVQFTSVVGNELEINIDATIEGLNSILFVAEDGVDVIEDSIRFLVVKETVTEEPPAGVEPGVTYLNDTSVILALFAPGKNNVFAVGDFSDWLPNASTAMKRSEDSTLFWVQINGLTPGEEYGYQFIVDGTVTIADPYGEKILDDFHDQFIGPDLYPNLKPFPTETSGRVSVLQTAKTPYPWQNTSYVRPEPGELIVYELLVRDFVAAHDYKTLIDSLDYLQGLGVNAIELMPIMEFEANSSWGYNPSFFFAADKYYGPENDLKAFIDSCHGRGMVVILDMVLNHAFGQNPLVRLYPLAENPFFNEVAAHPFNVGFDFDHEYEGTRYFSKRVLEFWLEEYHFDGYRMDLSKGFTSVPYGSNVGLWGQYDPSRVAILKDYFDHFRSVDSSAYFILEHFADNVEEKELAEYGMMLWGNIHGSYKEAALGYHENGKSDFSWISYQQRGWNVPHVVGYMESHDEQRLMHENLAFGNSSGNYNVKSLTTALERMKIAAAFLFTIPGPKMLWQFGELGYEVDINFNGRTGEKPIRWEYLDSWARRDLYDVWAAIIKLRTENEVFKTDDFDLDVRNEVKRINLDDPTMNVFIIGNFGVEERTGTGRFQQTGMWYDYMSGDSIDITDVNMSMSLLPGQYHIYTDKKLTTPSTIPFNLDPDQEGILNDVAVWPNRIQESANILYRLSRVGGVKIDIIDLNGKRVDLVLDLETSAPGVYELEWNTSGIAPGVYFVRMQTASKTDVEKVIIE